MLKKNAKLRGKEEKQETNRVKGMREKLKENVQSKNKTRRKL